MALSSIAKSAAASEAAGSTGKVHSVPVDEPEEGNEPLPSITDWAAGLPPMPVGKSDVIVIGEVSAATAELLKDGVRSEFTIRSEFNIQIDSVLKQPSKATLKVGGSLRAFRAGGSVQFPTGKTYLFNEYGQGAPAVGKNYVFFLLKNSATSPTFHISTAFYLDGEKVFSIDGKATGYSELPFNQYDGSDRSTFLSEVRKNIESQP